MKQLQYFVLKYLALIFLFLVQMPYKAHSQIITTIAGNGAGIYNGDNIPAIQAQFLPTAIATDRMGNLFISDLDNSRVRKIDHNGIITTAAGNGVANFGGDGGLAVNATLNYNWGIALDSELNLFIVDDGESRIRKVTSDDIINTIAGIDTVNGGGYNGDNILAINARFDHPSCIALDTLGNIYISDQGRRIRKINIQGIITTIAGTGVDGYSGDGGLAIYARIGDPIGIVADRTGNIYFTDIDNNVIRKVDKNGIITTVAGTGVAGYTGDGGPAKLAALNYPAGLAVNSDGTLFIADTYNYVIRKVDTAGIITTVIGEGSAGFSGDGGLAKDAKLNLPVALAFDNENNLLIADYGNARIRKVTPEVLAIVLISFNASYNSDGTIINWETASEINTAYFNVQRSHDGYSFTTIAKISAGNNGTMINNYQYIDKEPASLPDNVLFYRLQTIDKSGNSSYSKTVTIKLKSSPIITLYPNPAKDILNVKLSSDVKEMITIQITDAQGKVVQQCREQLSIGLNSLSINIATLAKGIYVLKMKGAATTRDKQFLKS